MKIRSAFNKLAEIPRKVIEYAQPRPETKGDTFEPMPKSGALMGFLEGSVVGGPMVGAAGAIGGYLGVKAGEKSGSFLKALGIGSTTGAALGVAGVAGLAAALGAPVTVPVLLASGVMGALSGATGTLAGSRRATTRDGTYGGFLTGMTAAIITKNPAMFLAGTAAAGIGGKAVKPAGRAVLGAVAGAGTGAMAGSLLGPMAAAIGAAAGAVAGAVGAVVGPAIRQIMRNITIDSSDKAFKKIEPFLDKHPLGKKSKMALGGVAGALTTGLLGLAVGSRFGVGIIGAAAGAGVGFIIGALGTRKELKARDEYEKTLQQAIKGQTAPPADSEKEAKQKPEIKD